MAVTSFRAESYHADLLSLAGEMRVVGLFRQAWRLRAEGGWMVTVTTALYNGPLTVRVDPLALSQLPVRVGATAIREGEALAIGPIAIDLAGATRWVPGVHGAGWEPQALERDLHRLRAVSGGADRDLPPPQLAVPGEPVGPGHALSRQATHALAALRTAVGAGDPAGTRIAVRALVGRGPGLTPTGDDLLCGFAAGMAVLRGRRDGAPPTVPATLARIMLEARARTTSLSRTLLAYAAGHGVAHPGPPVVLEPLLGVLWSLGTPGGGRDVAALLRIGHSSGRDMLIGAVAAAATVLEEGESGGTTLVDSG